MVAHLIERGVALFVSGCDFSILFDRNRDAADRAGVNDAGTAGVGGGVKDVACAFDIGGIHRGVIAQPEVIAGGDMKAPIASAHRCGESFAVGEVAFDVFVLRAVQAAGVAVFAEECFYIMPAQFEFMNEIGANEPGSPSDETIHKEEAA